jgi:hypothetical protein
LLRRRGTPHAPSRACPREAWSTFAPGESAHITHTVTASPILGATDGGIGTSPRTRRHEERWPLVPHLPAGLCCPGDGIDGAVWLAACFPSEGGELSHAACFEGSAREAEANATARALLLRGALLPARARIGRSRSCSRVVDVVAEVDRQCQTQRSGRSPLHPIWRTFRDGRLARGPMYESM